MAIEITDYTFTPEGLAEISKYKYGRNWPVTYILQKNDKLYIGETTGGLGRLKNHFDSKIEFREGKVSLITDSDFNKSSILLFESLLIEYLLADEKYDITNQQLGIKHNFFNKHSFERKFEHLWDIYLLNGFVRRDLLNIKNLDIFKYSPYKSLTEEQDEIASDIIKTIKQNPDQQNIFLINGGPGTGKSVLASYLAKEIATSSLGNVALVIAMTSLRKTFKKVFNKIRGLKSSQVIGPNQISNNKYDVLLIDEAHRLKQRINLTPGEYSAYDKENIRLGLDKEATQLDWVLNQAKNIILFFDENQTIRPSDVNINAIKTTFTKEYFLTSQMRIVNSNEFVDFVKDLFFGELDDEYNIGDYQLNLFEDFDKFYSEHQKNESLFGLSRIVAGYAWEWVSKNDETKFDINLGSKSLKWNTTNSDWVNSQNASKEVGCIHTVQGYDLNYVNLIIGSDITYNKSSKSIEINKENYKDKAGKRSISDEAVLKKYIQNIYITLMTRGIRGANIYIVDENFREYFQESMKKLNINIIK